MPAKSYATTMTATLVAALTAICLVVLSAGPALADVPRVAIIIDGSGSMGQDLSGRRTNPIEPIKVNVALDIAREAFGTLATDRPPMEISLMAFGLGERKDCASVDVLVPRRNSQEVGQVTLLNNALARVRPNGMTPIAFALEEAARELRHEDPGAVSRIILITDGEETCRQDPCMVARSLGDNQFDVDVHLIGFATTAKDQEKLSCICEETGGQCFLAKNGEQLETALDAALDAASESSLPTDSPSQSPLATLIGQPKPVVIEGRFQDLEGSFSIHATGADQRLGDVYRIITGAVPASVATIRHLPRELSLEPGNYVVGLKLDGHRRDVDFTIDDSSIKRVIVTFPPARLKVSAVSIGSGELVRNRLIEWRVDRPEVSSDWTALTGNPSEIALPKGTHRIRLRIGNRPIMSKLLPLLAGQTKQEEFEVNWRPRAELAFAVKGTSPQLFASSRSRKRKS